MWLSNRYHTVANRKLRKSRYNRFFEHLINRKISNITLIDDRFSENSLHVSLARRDPDPSGCRRVNDESARTIKAISC